MVTKRWRVGHGYKSISDIYGRRPVCVGRPGVPNCQLPERVARITAARLAAEEVELGEGG